MRRRRAARFSLLLVGTWCLRKGCDLLMEAVKRVPGGASHPCRPDWRFEFSDRRSIDFCMSTRRPSPSWLASMLRPTFSCWHRAKTGLVLCSRRLWPVGCRLFARTEPAAPISRTRRRSPPVLRSCPMMMSTHWHVRLPDGGIAGVPGRNCRRFWKPIARNSAGPPMPGAIVMSCIASGHEMTRSAAKTRAGCHREQAGDLRGFQRCNRARSGSRIQAAADIAGLPSNPGRAPAGEATAPDRHRDRRAVSSPRSRTRTACARPSREILFLRTAGTGAALRTSRRVPCSAFAAGDPGCRLGADRATPYAKDARARPLRIAKPRSYDAAASLRRFHLHVGDLSGSCTLCERALWRGHMARNGRAGTS